MKHHEFVVLVFLLHYVSQNVVWEVGTAPSFIIKR
jgi:hypothetical protein